MQTVLFVGAGRHQRRAIERARELGLRVVAVDGEAGAPGLAVADVAEVVSFSDVPAVIEVGRRHGVDGVLTVSADRAVPVVAAVAEALGLPGIGTETARAMTNKLTMRRRLAGGGVPQPRFAAVRTLEEGLAALETVGVPAVLKPADSGGQRGIFRLESAADLERDLPGALAESARGEAIVEGFHDGLELNGLVVARDGEATTVTLSDRLRPPGVGFGVGWIHLYPPSLPPETVAEAERVAAQALRALGLRDGIAFPQLLVTPDGEVLVVEVAARIPGGQMADLARHAVGVDLVEVALRRALGEEISDELVVPRFRRPLAIRFLTAKPGPLPTGRVTSLGGMEKVLAAPGVLQADVYFGAGDTVRPVRLDADRMGYVIATGEGSAEALERAEAAARLFDVEVEPECPFDLDHYRKLLEAAREGGYRFALFDGDPSPGDLLLRHDVDLEPEAALVMAELEATLGVRATYFLMTGSVFYNLETPRGSEILARLRELGHAVGLHAAWPERRLDERFDPLISWHNPDPGTMHDPLPEGVNVMEHRFFANYRSDSNQVWRHGCPHEELRSGAFDWLQLLIHPEIWVYPGESMRETMLAMLDAERERRLRQLADDRIDLS